jgi:aconitase B
MNGVKRVEIDDKIETVIPEEVRDMTGNFGESRHSTVNRMLNWIYTDIPSIDYEKVHGMAYDGYMAPDGIASINGYDVAFEVKVSESDFAKAPAQCISYRLDGMLPYVVVPESDYSTFHRRAKTINDVQSKESGLVIIDSREIRVVRNPEL